MTGDRVERGEETHRATEGNGCGKTEAETGVILLQAKEHRGWPGATKS